MGKTPSDRNSQSQPRIAIAHEFLTRMGGAERVVKVISEMYPQARIFTLLYDEEKVGSEFSPLKVETSSLQKFPRFMRKHPKLLLPFIRSAVEAWDFSDYDIVITSSSAWMQGIITPLKTRQICYCHSPARFLWDYSHEYLRENKITGIKKWFLGSLLREIRIWNQLSAKRVNRFIANSKTVAERIRKYYRRDSEVIYPPVEVEKIRLSNHHENYFLIVSQLTRYKRIDLAISVFNKLRRRLVIVGDGPQRDYLERISGKTIEFHGWRSNAEVAELLRNCRGFIFPGEDDFGIAPVEAMAAGKPVLAFGRGGATETIIPKQTGILFAAQTPESLEDGLAQFFTTEKKFQPALIRSQAKKFSRQHFEEKLRRAVKREWEILQKELK
ncbi:MAG: glycosyltransferase [Candidatus Gracilibacteria bacterium]|jgi:glycosyltransferase involved in cell wall biosynthesis